MCWIEKWIEYDVSVNEIDSRYIYTYAQMEENVMASRMLTVRHKCSIACKHYTCGEMGYVSVLYDICNCGARYACHMPLCGSGNGVPT